jgi:hypothetical protein
VAPPKPEAVLPKIDIPSSPPPDGSGRLVVDVAEEEAKVSRVLDTTTFSSDSRHPEWQSHHGHAVAGPSPTLRRVELLCISPCVLDLRQGAHSLVFTSTRDDTRTGTGDVIVTSKPAAVRHALGKEKPASAPYVGGMMLTLLGGGLTTIGALATTVGAVAKRPEDDPSGRTKGDPSVFLGIGLVALGIGLVTGTTGLVMMANNRPEHQPGSTAQWALP